MFRKILVPIDGSDTSKRGLEEALRLAAREGARIRIMNVVDESAIPAYDPAAVGGDADFVTALKTAGQKALKQAAAAAARKRMKAECVQRMSSGRSVSDVIVAEAKKWADVLVMGTHGRRGFNRLLLGSDAERVLRETPVPILLVRK